MLRKWVEIVDFPMPMEPVKPTCTARSPAAESDDGDAGVVMKTRRPLVEARARRGKACAWGRIRDDSKHQRAAFSQPRIKPEERK